MQVPAVTCNGPSHHWTHTIRLPRKREDAQKAGSTAAKLGTRTKKTSRGFIERPRDSQLWPGLTSARVSTLPLMVANVKSSKYISLYSFLDADHLCSRNQPLANSYHPQFAHSLPHILNRLLNLYRSEPNHLPRLARINRKMVLRVAPFSLFT